MKQRKLMLAAACALGLLSMGRRPAAAAEVLYDGSGFLQGTQSFVKSFSLPSAGTLTVTLTNVNWPQQLSSLNLLVTSAGGAVGHEMGAGTSTFDIKEGEDVFAQWFGTAQGPLNTGVYSMEIEFEPSASGSPVPLPTSIILLLSGLGLLVWQRRSGAGDVRQLAGDLHRIGPSDRFRSP